MLSSGCAPDALFCLEVSSPLLGSCHRLICRVAKRRFSPRGTTVHFSPNGKMGVLVFSTGTGKCLSFLHFIPSFIRYGRTKKRKKNVLSTRETTSFVIISSSSTLEDRCAHSPAPCPVFAHPHPYRTIPYRTLTTTAATTNATRHRPPDDEQRSSAG